MHDDDSKKIPVGNDTDLNLQPSEPEDANGAKKAAKKHLIHNKWLRWVMKTLACIVVVIILIPLLLYVPPIQDFLVKTATGIVAEKTGMKIGIGKFRLKFPLDVSLQDVSVIEVSGDTMVLAKEVVADVKLMPLLHLDAQINKLKLVDAYYRMISSDSSMLMTIRAGLLQVDDKSSADIANSVIDLNDAYLKNGKVNMYMDVWKQKPSPQDTTSTPFYIKAKKLNVENILFTMSMLPTIDTLQFHASKLTLNDGIIDLRESKMSLGSVAASDGFAQMIAPSADYVKNHPAPEADTTSVSVPFTINADSISLADFYARYAVEDSPSVDGFDPNDIRVSNLSITLKNFYDRASTLSLPIASLSGKMFGGKLEILKESNCVFSMDSAGMNIKDFHILTTNSHIDATAAIPNALMEMLPSALLDVDISASLGVADVNAFMPDLRPYTVAIPASSPINAVVKASGSLGDADIDKVDVKIPGVLSLRASGNAKNALDFKQLVAKLNFEGELQKPSIADNFVEIKGFGIPALSFKGTASAIRENYAANFNLSTSRGSVVGEGKVGMNSELYEADLSIRNLNVGSFIGDSLIGNVTAHLYARGAGFNPEKKGTHTDIKLNLNQLVYNHQNLKDIDLVATLQNGAFSIDANSFSSPLNLNIKGKGSISDDFYQADLEVDIHNIDLMALGMSETTNYGAGRIHLYGNASPRAWTYDVTLDADSLNWHLPDQDLVLQKGANLRLNADASHTLCELTATGASLQFLSPSGLKSVVDSFSAVADLFPKIIEEKKVDVVAIEEKLPIFSLKADVDGSGIAKELLSSSDMSFGSLNLNLSKDSVLKGDVVVDNLKSGTTRLDTITFNMKSRGQLIDYQVHLGNRPGTLDEFADVNVRGYLGENRLSAYLVQHNIRQKMGYRLGFTASLANSVMSIRFTPLKATIAYLPWQFNSDNYVDINFLKKVIEANLEASSDESSILLQTEPVADGGNSLHLNLKNIHVQDFLQMALNAPPLTANVNSDINVRYNGKAILGKGSLDINDLVFARKKVGNLSFTLAAGLGNNGRSGGKVGFLVNGAEAAAVQFLLAPDSINPNGSMVAERLNLELTKFPLSIANPFIPPGIMSLSGALTGNMAMSGSFVAPRLNGSIESDSVGVYVDMLGTTLRFGSEPIVVADNVLKFDNFNISAVNENPLTINGTVDASKFSNILLDFTAKADNLQLVGVKKSKADITGTLFADLDASVKGSMSRLNVDATVDILPTTDVVYNMVMGGSDMLSGQSSSEDVVRFVNFADTTVVAKADSLQSSLAMRINAKAIISQGAQVTVNLGSSGKIELNPSGTLNYSQKYMGDMKLNGTLYTGNGYASYSLPLMGMKEFTFDRNSHITWNGDILNPSLDINATDDVKTNIQMNGNTSLVNFIVSLKVGNTLSAPSVSFDLSTNDDMSISNELQSMTADQRQQQAMNLLITGTYTGPSAKSVKSNLISTGSLYSFLTSQLNALAAKSIKGVDINFGVDQYESGTNGNTSTTTSYSYQVSKSLINNRFKIVVGGNYSTDASADENFQQNLISDIAFEYILRQTNTMSLNARLFRHTGFESILEGEITETGVGLTLRRRLAYFTEITHFGLSKLWKKHKKTEEPAPSDSIQALPTEINSSERSEISEASEHSDNPDISDSSDENTK